MKNWMKTLLCSVATATLVACGGGDGTTATTTTTTTTGTTSVESLAGVASGMELAAGLAIDGVEAGFYGTVGTFPTAGLGFEAPAALADPTVPTCTNGGTATWSAGPSKVTYTNCKVGDATLNGVAGIVYNASVATVTFDIVPATPLTITAEGEDGKTTTFTYTGNQVVSNLVGTPGSYTGGKVVLNAVVKIGASSTVTLTNFKVEWSTSGDIETTSLDGKYATILKLSDFGVPATPGVPETMAIEFTVTTPTAVQFNKVTDQDVAGVIKFVSTGFTIEVDFGARKARFTPLGGTTQEFTIS